MKVSRVTGSRVRAISTTSGVRILLRPLWRSNAPRSPPTRARGQQRPAAALGQAVQLGGACLCRRVVKGMHGNLQRIMRASARRNANSAAAHRVRLAGAGPARRVVRRHRRHYRARRLASGCRNPGVSLAPTYHVAPRALSYCESCHRVATRFEPIDSGCPGPAAAGFRDGERRHSRLAGLYAQLTANPPENDRPPDRREDHVLR